jgi:hypothetical protein
MQYLSYSAPLQLRIILEWLNSSTSVVLTSNVCYKEFRARIMGLTQAVGGLGRFLGPSLFTAVYGWSCHKKYFPIHHGLVFYVSLNFVVNL